MNITAIILAVVFVSVIGLVLGLVLAVASIVMAVPVDERAVQISEVLPGANCGACGFSGCSGYADALSKGKTTECNLCAPGGADVAAEVANIMGLSAGSSKPMSAVVMCHGTNECSGSMMNYHGDMGCKTASQLFGGPKACNYGCLGLGDCVKECPYDAIAIENGIAKVNPLACRACKLCIKACPKSLIELVPVYEAKAVVYCKNKSKGAQARKECSVACIGCMKCVKACEFDAIKVENNVAHVDAEKCTGCGKCVAGCPTHCLQLVALGVAEQPKVPEAPKPAPKAAPAAPVAQSEAPAAE